VRVGAKPGETRDIKQVGIEKGLKVLDMPGIVWGDFLGDSTSVENGAPGIGSLNMMGVEFLEDPVGAGKESCCNPFRPANVFM
jgi:nuclear GTP-binding protein